jgi:hypothetical protein
MGWWPEESSPAVSLELLLAEQVAFEPVALQASP